MILNLSAGENTSEEVNVLLTEFMSEVNNTLTNFKSEVNSMLTGFTRDIDSDITTLSNNVATVKTDVATVKSSVSTMNTTVSNLGGAVKSIQRGVHGGSNNHENIIININPVNPDKCVVFISMPRNSWTYSSDYQPQLVSITTTSITVSPSGTYSDGTMSPSSFSWQVVEFY